MKKILPLLLLLSACTVGPDYHKPDMKVAPGFRDLPAGQDAPLSRATADAPGDLSAWWTVFGDKELESLITRALQANPDLLTAASKVREARTQEVIAGAAGLPQVNGSALAAHLHSNSNIASKIGGGSSSSGSSSSGATDIKLYSLGFDASWEIDIFGGVRRGVEAAEANTEAARWQMRDGEVMLSAEIAEDYFMLRSLQARIILISDEAQRQRGTYDLARAKARAGLVTQLDVNQQSGLADTTAAQIPQLQAQARVQEHAIAVLMGEDPEAMEDELERSAPGATIPASLPVGLPSDLLRRRPDVRAAERKLASATAEIGVAVADLYPKFNLLAGLSFAGNHLDNLLSGDNLGEFGLGSIMWPIFHGGQGHANIHAKEEDEQQAYYAYRKAVLGAVRDAEDALTRYAADQRRLVSLNAAADAAQSSAQIAEAQYRAGLASYDSVYTAQASALSARDAGEQARQSYVTDLVALYKALGGGWSEDCSICTAPASADNSASRP
jgi:NodT family efflux transporter outer membrane factor (OMF) lipoprotein